jgi:hypothetical protein
MLLQHLSLKDEERYRTKCQSRVKQIMFTSTISIHFKLCKLQILTAKKSCVEPVNNR